MIEEEICSYLKYLPGIYQDVPDKYKINRTNQLLKIFEKILSGIDDSVKVRDEFGNEKDITGIEEVIDKIHDYFDPLYAPGLNAAGYNFVTYLSKWVTLTLKQNWSEKKQRRLIADIIPLYKKRGTKEGLNQIFRIYLGDGPLVTIEDIVPEIQVGLTSYIYTEGLQLGGYIPHFFSVHIVLIVEVVDINSLRELEKNLHNIVDLEKPAHTYYTLYYDTNKAKFPGIQVGISQKCEVGKTTLIFGS